MLHSAHSTGKPFKFRSSKPSDADSSDDEDDLDWEVDTTKPTAVDGQDDADGESSDGEDSDGNGEDDAEVTLDEDDVADAANIVTGKRITPRNVGKARKNVSTADDGDILMGNGDDSSDGAPVQPRSAPPAATTAAAARPASVTTLSQDGRPTVVVTSYELVSRDLEFMHVYLYICTCRIYTVLVLYGCASCCASVPVRQFTCSVIRSRMQLFSAF